MTGETLPVDEAEVERLTRVIVDALDEGDPGRPSGCLGCWPLWTGESASQSASAVLARWHLVPREGDERVMGECAECGREGAMTKAGAMRVHNGTVYDGRWRQVCRGAGARPNRTRTVRTIPDGNGGTWVHTGPWQPVEDGEPS